MLMASLRQMGAGAAHPLEMAAFEPFEEDFDTIRKSYKALESDVAARGDSPANYATEDDLIRSIDDLLKIVTESVAAYNVCTKRIDAVEEALKAALEGTGVESST